MKHLIISVALVAIAGLAHATPGGEGNNTGCNGVGNANSPCTGTNNTGGAGGAGGTGVGVGVGIAAAQANAAAIAASNASANQAQGQQQGQAQSSRNTNTATGGAGGHATATGGASGGNTLAGGAVTVSVEGAKGDTYIAPAQERNPVATAYAAPLTAANGTCMGSTSAGAQGVSLGVSFGTTWKDDDCNGRYDAAALIQAGQPRAAVSRLCQSASNRKAMEDAGTPCPGANAKRADATPSIDGDGFATRKQPAPWQAGG
jgi:hypothetical protein